jgi:pimeloyl-ACP methyl ester carboxylesterase
MALASVLVATPSAQSQQLGPAERQAYEEYQRLAPHRAFAVTPDGRGFGYATGHAGPDPGSAVESAITTCRNYGHRTCNVYAVNNVVLHGRPWERAAPPVLPTIGRLRPENFWANAGPRAAAGLIVWSHGYAKGTDSEFHAPQGEVAYFTLEGFDLYRFDRKVILDWHSDAVDLATAVRQARALGYRRIVLAGQSAGAWVSLAAAARGAPVEGVISVSAAHHGEVKSMRDPDFARSEWRKLVTGIQRGPRVLLVQFAGDAFDVGGRMAVARETFDRSTVDAVIIDQPHGFTGHFAGAESAFARTFGTCIHAFIEHGQRRAPCT